jgi:hypothetical protein
MRLIDGTIAKDIPKIYGQRDRILEAIAYIKFYTPDSFWSWYVLEFDGADIFYGLVKGLAEEFGYFSLCELEEIKGPLGLSIARDIYFIPARISKFMQEDTKMG